MSVLMTFVEEHFLLQIRVFDSWQVTVFVRAAQNWEGGQPTQWNPPVAPTLYARKHRTSRGSTTSFLENKLGFVVFRCKKLCMRCSQTYSSTRLLTDIATAMCVQGHWALQTNGKSTPTNCKFTSRSLSLNSWASITDFVSQTFCCLLSSHICENCGCHQLIFCLRKSA